MCGPAILESFIPAALSAFAYNHKGIGVDVEYLPPDIERIIRRQHRILLPPERMRQS